MIFDNKKTSLVIATYNWPKALDLVLKSVLNQTLLPGEIRIADDGSGEDTKRVIESYQAKFDIPVKHFWHEDNGYRKTFILNDAMRGIENEYIIQIDGDVILHPRFIEDHLKWCKKGCWLNGSRVLLGKDITQEIQSSGKVTFSPLSSDITNRLNAVRLPLLRNLLYDKEAFSTNARGCNMSYWAADFFKVNGFNQDIVGYSREDSELAARFSNIGVKRRLLKFSGVQYHLDHKLASRSRSEQNINIEKQTIDSGVTFCTNGLEKLASTV
ncbi:glycosyltransferase family 2 protein [Roseivirga pacifica]|uniref:glycosyltransferase family 2 protein n=1 Tax=Roseivirga pacifica TaxID=1267423 RepID=UPI00227CC59D|nr:glycosyltransferase family 2 protein [Roseivirga pacifica]